jgi:hypothetical protein
VWAIGDHNATSWDIAVFFYLINIYERMVTTGGYAAVLENMDKRDIGKESSHLGESSDP